MSAFGRAGGNKFVKKTSPQLVFLWGMVHLKLWKKKSIQVSCFQGACRLRFMPRRFGTGEEGPAERGICLAELGVYTACISVDIGVDLI